MIYLNTLPIFRIIFCLSLLQPASLAYAETIKGPISAEVIRVIDGDTIEVNAHVWVGQYIRTKVRLLDIDTPEIRRPKCEAERVVGQRAKAMTEDLIGTEILLHNVKMGSFGGRVLAHLETETGEDLGAALIAHSLAVAYKADKPWCHNHDDGITANNALLFKAQG